MTRSISKEYLLFSMDETGKLIKKDNRIYFLTSCLIELLLKDVVYIENENLYIKNQLQEENNHLLPLYKTIKYSAAMKPAELLLGVPLNELFNSVKEALIKEKKTIEIKEIKIFGKDKIYIISKDTEINNILENIKNLIKNNNPLDETTTILIDLLLKSNIIQDSLSLSELNYIRSASEKIRSNESNETYKALKKRVNSQTLVSNMLDFIQDTINLCFLFIK